MRASPETRVPTLWVLVGFCGFLLGAWATVNHAGPIAVFSALFALGLVQLAEQQMDAIASDFRDACRDTDLPLVKAALHMGLDDSDLGKILRGLQKFDLRRIEMLPEETQRCFYYRRAQRKGLPTFIKHALKMAPAFVVEGTEQ